MAFDYTGLIQSAALPGAAFTQAFRQGRAEAQHRATEGALAQYVMNPSEQGAAAVALHNPMLGLELQDRENARASQLQKQQQEARAIDLRQRAAGGDRDALSELAGIDPKTWKDMSANQRQQIEDQVDYIGNAALNISRLPEADRAQAWESAVDQGVRLGYGDLERFRGGYSEQALQGALSQAGMIKDFINVTKPDFQVIPEGGTLVDTRDPNAVAAYSSGQQPGGGQPVRVSSPEEAQRLPPGTRFIDPNGVVRMVPGGASSNAGGNFPPGG